MNVGYENAPVVQSLSILTLILSYAMTDHSQIDLNSNSLFTHPIQIFRLFTSQLVFRNKAQAIVGLILLYSCRDFERQMGSKKFGAFLSFSFFLSLLLLLPLGMIDYCRPSPGPFFIIFSLLAFYYHHIPRMSSRNSYSFLGMTFSQKSWVYLLSLQLMLSNGANSAIPSVIGYLSGYLYDHDRLGPRLQSLRLPAGFTRVVGTAGQYLTSLCPSFTSMGSSAGRNTPPNGMENDSLLGGGGGMSRGRDMGNGGGGGGGFSQLLPGGNNLTQRGHRQQALPQPDEASISRLMGMGFERDNVIRALQSAGNNVEAAANLLLR